LLLSHPRRLPNAAPPKFANGINIRDGIQSRSI
jgi:hypothetical protein